MIKMKKDEFLEKLIKFIKTATCSFTCIEEIKKELKKNGFIELNEQEQWDITKKKYYIIRNNASIIAIDISKATNNNFSIITSHSDTPSLLLKPEGSYIKENYLKYNVMPYGGLLNFGWLDHPLSIAGRVIIKKDKKLVTKIIDFKKPMLVIPSVAIHQKTDSNTNLDLNMQIDLQPIIALSKNKNIWDNIIQKEIKEQIIDYELFAYCTEEPVIIGTKQKLLVSPRIDNLTSVFTSLKSFIEQKSDNIKVFCCFNNEEIGSLTEEGADSNFLLDILKRFASSLNIDIASSLANSFIISSDNTHAIHPNHTEYADDTGVLYLGQGFAIIKEINSTTNAVSSAILKTICDNNKIKYQYSTAKNDVSGGSTLSGISLRHVSVLSIDVGIPQLSMHSSVETCSIDDVYQLYLMMKSFYKTTIIKNNTNYQIK